MTKRETLLAEIATLQELMEPHEQRLADLQARLAELDAEPDYEAWRPACNAWLEAAGYSSEVDNAAFDNWSKSIIRGLIAAFAKAPPMGSGMTEAEIEALAKKSAENAYAYNDPEKAYAQNAARVAIRQTLSRVQPRWPSEGELREMAQEIESAAENNLSFHPMVKFAVNQATCEMARRIRAYQTGEQP